MTDVTELVLYTGLLLGITMGMTAWRLAAAHGTIRAQVDGMLGFCLLTSSVLFVSAVLPGAQLP
ncbi:hypothetical protein [Nocardioides stalactiti]|uniref:hypothetical protein n=1 Tax=Nocardioides stalactiti TaxID=2755356 RepID=UPI0016017169|nr:hypothetical protein [Nocardioides stalactiti]